MAHKLFHQLNNDQYESLTTIAIALRHISDCYLSSAHLTYLGIEQSPLDLESPIHRGCSSFFAPASASRVSVYRSEEVDPSMLQFDPLTWSIEERPSSYDQSYALCRDLLRYVREFRGRYRYFMRWKSVPQTNQAFEWSKQFSTTRWYHLTDGAFDGAFDLPHTDKPHTVVRLRLNCKADDRVTKSELLTLICFMMSAMIAENKQWNATAKTKRRSCRRMNVIFPVQLISILNPVKVRILQAHADEAGVLHLRCSKFYDFDTLYYHNAMDTILRWMLPTARGNTTRTCALGTLRESESEEDLSV